MKTLKAPLLSIAFVVLNVFTVLSNSSHPPPPDMAKTAKSNAVNAGPVLPGTPIDENIVFLMVAGTVLGITVLYKSKIKKASV